MRVDKNYMQRVTEFLTNIPFENGFESYDFIGGIVGGEAPSSYSKSPDLWNAFFSRMGINAVFGAFDFPPDGSLSRFVRTVFDRPFCIDLTVTNPYKAAAYDILPSLPGKILIPERVHHLGGLNHMIPDFRTGEIFVDSTDGMGMVRALLKRRGLDGARVLLAGAGGAAAAIGYELVRAGAELFIANIIEADAQDLAGRLQNYSPPGGRILTGDWGSILKEAPNCDILVSAVTVSKPLNEKQMDLLHADCLLVDTRYGDKAEFAEAAEKTGRLCIDGREMLFGQFYIAAERVGGLLGCEADTVKNILKTIESLFLTSRL
jgi:shikimate dehydrogenase